MPDWDDYYGTCSVNVLIQIICFIPGLKDDIIDIIEKKNGNADDILNAVSICINLYQDATKAENFPLDIKEVIPEDITASVDTVLRQLPNQYGLTLNEERYIIIMQNDLNLSLTETIQEVTNDNEFFIYKLLMFKKDYTTKYLYPEVVDYDSFVMVLKMLIIRDDEPQPYGHFRLYLREYFSENWLMVNDNQIKPASIEEIYNDQICLAIYYIVNKNDSNGQENKTENTITSLEMHETLKTYLETNHPGYKFSGQIVTRNEEAASDMNDILPRTRLIIKATKSKK